MDKLDIVNHLLQTVGERRVLTLETGHPSVAQAVQALEGYDFDFQSQGWWFNRNRAQKLLPNNLGEVLLPAECLSAVLTDAEQFRNKAYDKSRFVRRGGRMYDNIRNTFELGHALVLDIILQLAVEDLPPQAATYLKHMSAEAYYVDDDGDMVKADKLKERTTMAWHVLKAEQLKVEQTNALDSPAAVHLNYRIRQQGSSSNPLYPGGYAQ